MGQLSADTVLKSVLSFKREGGVAEIKCDTVDGEAVTLRFDVRYLWSVAADMRLASIDLVAPVPDALKAALGSDADAEVDEKKDVDPQAADQEEPRSGFPGLEQAWDLCDLLNDAILADPDTAPETVFGRVAQGHFLIEEPAELLQIEGSSGFEVNLKNEFKIIFRPETKDWIPDRRDKAPDVGLQAG